MEIPGYFQSMAEIGVAIAGFSGLIVSMRKEVGSLKGVQKYRLNVLLSLALGAMFLSLLPELLVSFGAQGERVWKVACLVALIFSLVFASWWITASIRIRPIEPQIFNWFVFSRMCAGHALVALLQLAYLLSVFDVSGAAAFSVALIWYLLHAVQQFTRMLFIRTRSDLA